VIGADGRNSLVAKTVRAEEYNVRPALTCGYYAYWSDVPPHPSSCTSAPAPLAPAIIELRRPRRGVVCYRRGLQADL